MNWYKQSREEVLKNQRTSIEKGLTDVEAYKRLKQFGSNELQEEARAGLLSKIADQFSDFLVLILIGAAIISAFIGEIRDSLVILAIVVINAALGIYQEGRAERALHELRKMTSPTAKVIRNGHMDIVPANKLVPGDLVVLEAGDIIPADLRLVESVNLKIDEAALTGESIPVEKDSSKFFKEEVPLGDRVNMAYMGTSVTYGRGKGIVVETGHNTEIGKIATMIKKIAGDPTPLQLKLNQLGKNLGSITLLVCAAVFILGLFQGRGILDMFMVAISLAVAAIPEGLPAIVTIVLAIGMNNMVKRNAIVKKLLAVETLGSTTVICSDKTGTLTQNQMTAVRIFVNNKIIEVTGVGYETYGQFKMAGKKIDVKKNLELKKLLTIGALANDARLERVDNRYKVIGDPTEGALVTLAYKGNMAKEELDNRYPRVGEIPFDSNRKMMTTFHKNYLPGKIVSFTKGAPDIVLDKCSHICIDGKLVELDEDLRSKILNVNNYFAKDALRVLALSYREFDQLPDEMSSENIEKGMIFLGLVGMIDPPRPEAKEAIKKCKEAGIKPIMITGDYKETAFAIARELNMVDSMDEVMEGKELDLISSEKLKEMAKKIKVYARVSPEHKVKIVSALKSNGEIVAMTGDGVNDAMALKKADIGISMGITGTDVAKNTAEVILTDDNFASIVSAVEEGRIIYSNIRKFVFFLLSCNIGEIIIVFASILLNLPVPLLPIQLLWLNLVTDSFPALALGVEKGDDDIMKVKPRNPEDPIIDSSMMYSIIVQSLAIGATSLLAYTWGLKAFPDNLIKARTIAFSTLILAELLRAYSSRSEKQTLFEVGIFSNPTMVYATFISFLLLLVVIYVPVLQPVFHTAALTLLDWGIIVSFVTIPLLIGEIYKVLFN
ncbi:MAG: calcium-translocating P-type ATPase, SERCA-type [Tissierellia bacterium]|nr:calcium-translocating P-type ATPase, SERCA-type [Tissierellia bacterium]